MCVHREKAHGCGLDTGLWKPRAEAFDPEWSHLGQLCGGGDRRLRGILALNSLDTHGGGGRRLRCREQFGQSYTGQRAHGPFRVGPKTWVQTWWMKREGTLPHCQGRKRSQVQQAHESLCWNPGLSSLHTACPVSSADLSLHVGQEVGAGLSP